MEIATKNKQIAVLIDPDKTPNDKLESLSARLNTASPDIILIGGSTYNGDIDCFVKHIKQLTTIPVILFPGNNKQFTPAADGILLLSLISGRNPDYLIGQHINSALQIRHSGIEVIPTGYILIDGGKCSATQIVSHTTPIARNDVSLITNTAVAGELLGMKAIYLEAGSGAVIPVPQPVIKHVKSELSIPLIVGGGISNKQQITDALNAGADIIVIGNYFEQHPEKMDEFCHIVHSFNS